VIGERLKLARSASGLSLRELEDRVGGLVSAQAIGKYERDEMMPGSGVLIALARALSVSEDYLLRQDDVELVGVEFRKHRVEKAKDRARVQAQILSAVERYLEVEDLLALSSAWHMPKGLPKARRPLDGEEAAKALRAHWKLGVDPIPSLAEFLEEKAIKIISVPLPERVSGVKATVKQKNGTLVQAIVLNSEQPGERQRFTLSHELGHLVLDLRSVEEKIAEAICNRFAGAFLVPEHTLRAELGNNRTSISIAELFSLKKLFGVSAQAIAYRASDLGIINDSLKQAVFIEFGKRGWRKVEPESELIPREHPARFKRLCLRALSEEVISLSKAAELLDIGSRELLASLDNPASARADDSSPCV
jgi:Zn-dependent peptidase ImmA (M78 family)/transcriptional regulator with XRE-family HTH domain